MKTIIAAALTVAASGTALAQVDDVVWDALVAADLALAVYFLEGDDDSRRATGALS